MNFTSYQPLSSFGSRGTISELYDTFRSHTDLLFEQKYKATQAVEDWANSLITQIRDHAKHQKNLIDEAYQNYRKHIEDMRGQYIEANSIYTRNGDTEEINRLLEKCKRFEITLVELNFQSKHTKFIEVTAIEPNKLTDNQDHNSLRTVNERLENPPIYSTDTRDSTNRDFGLNSAYSNSHYTNPSRIK